MVRPTQVFLSSLPPTTSYPYLISICGDLYVRPSSKVREEPYPGTVQPGWETPSPAWKEPFKMMITSYFYSVSHKSISFPCAFLLHPYYTLTVILSVKKEKYSVNTQTTSSCVSKQQQLWLCPRPLEHLPFLSSPRRKLPISILSSCSML